MSVSDYPLAHSETHQCQDYNEREKDRVKNLIGVHKSRSCFSLEANKAGYNSGTSDGYPGQQ